MKNLKHDQRLRILEPGAPEPKVHGPKLMRSSLRAHKDVLGAPHRQLAIADIRRRAKDGDNGGAWLKDKFQELTARRIDVAMRRRFGERVCDNEAEGASFANLNILDLQRALDFQVTVPADDPAAEGRATVDTAASPLAVSAIAFADVTVAYESVPSVADELVGQEIDDKHDHTEIPVGLDFGKVGNKTDDPEPLGENDLYREAGTGEDRLSILSFKDGYQRAFSQRFIERAPAQIFSLLSDLGAGAREVMEWIQIGWIIDYWGSRGTNPQLQSLNLNRAATSLFSSTANTPGPRAPNGTRILNNRLEDPTDLENARARLVSMRNPAGFPVANWLETILVPDAAWQRAWEALKSEKTPGVFNQQNFFGPSGAMPSPRLISSPMLDLFTTTSWYAGRPGRQIIRKWATRPEVVVNGGQDTRAYLDTREGFRTRIGWDMRIGMSDYIYWIENLDAETPPGGA